MSNKRKIFSYFKNKTIRKIENLNSLNSNFNIFINKKLIENENKFMIFNPNNINFNIIFILSS